jgi:hypothetical protein
MATSKVKSRITRKVVQTEEEQILGIEPIVEAVSVIDYESPERKYKVTGLHEGTTPVFVNGTVIETFIGSTNRDVREKLREGAKKVTTKDGNGKDAYIIEVIK